MVAVIVRNVTKTLVEDNHQVASAVSTHFESLDWVGRELELHRTWVAFTVDQHVEHTFVVVKYLVAQIVYKVLYAEVLILGTSSIDPRLID